MVIYNGNYTVYIHTNKINNKMYIGITKQKVENRWKKGSTYKGNPHFYAAILKYGWDNFEHEVFASNLTKDEAFNMEKLLIKIFKTQNNEFGYNVTGGGDVPITHSEEVRRKISEAVSGVNHPCYGKHLSYETRMKISKSEKGKKSKPTNNKYVKCVETNVIYESAAEASRQLGINRTCITMVLRNKRKTAGNYHWEYANVS